MAPAKTAKRGAATQQAPKASVAPAVKKVKKMPVDPNHAGVIDGLRQAAGLNEQCLEMLLAALPTCFTLPAADRHAHQKLVISMIKDALNQVTTKMQEGIDAEGSKVVEVEAEKSRLECKVAEVAAELASKNDVAEAKKVALAEISQAVYLAKTKASEAKEAQSKGDASLEEAKTGKAEIEAALEANLQAVKGADWNGENSQQHVGVLMPLGKRFACDESLLTALPASCSKKSSERGGFDQMVIDQLEAGLKTTVAELAATLEAAAPASAERQAAVEAAQQELDKALADQQQAALELSFAQAEELQASTAVKEAEATVAAFKPTYEGATAARDAKAAELKNFEDYNMQCFALCLGKEEEAAQAGA